MVSSTGHNKRWPSGSTNTGVVGWGIWLDVGAHVVWDAVPWDGTQVEYLRTDRAALPVRDCLDQTSGGVAAMSGYDRLDSVLGGPEKNVGNG